MYINVYIITSACNMTTTRYSYTHYYYLQAACGRRQKYIFPAPGTQGHDWHK